MYKAVKYFTQKTYQPIVSRYLRKNRVYRYKGIQLLVPKGVFHPGLFFSTRFLIRELEKMELKNRSLLELGAGSGLISIVAAKNGARVMASDFSSLAISGLEYNFRQSEFQGLSLQIVHSDLFDSIPVQTFDFIIINPPYYPKDATGEAEMAWYCGLEFQYFQKLFGQVGNYINASTTTCMSLSQDCDLNRISGIAAQNNLEMKLWKKKRIWWEENYIFNIIKKQQE